MLVLSRKVGESIVIGDLVYCTIVGYKENEVRIGFDAPLSIPIHRDEIQRLIRKQNGGLNQLPANQDAVVDQLIRTFKPELLFGNPQSR